MTLHDTLTEPERAESVRANLSRLRDRIRDIAASVGRDPAGIELHGATKTVPPDVVRVAVANGLTNLGENWIQEAEPKIAAVRTAVADSGLPQPTWHMIGHLQRNKARQALELFDVIGTVDSLRLAETLHRRAADIGREHASIFLEVDFTDDPARGGFRLGAEHGSARNRDFIDDVRHILDMDRLNLTGLMTVAPQTDDPEGARPAFRRLRGLLDEINDSCPNARLSHLSMGMTNDFPVAIAEGATIIRLGTAIFGARPPGRSY